jgi:hypothetical protein
VAQQLPLIRFEDHLAQARFPADAKVGQLLPVSLQTRTAADWNLEG